MPIDHETQFEEDRPAKRPCDCGSTNWTLSMKVGSSGRWICNVCSPARPLSLRQRIERKLRYRRYRKMGLLGG